MRFLYLGRLDLGILGSYSHLDRSSQLFFANVHLHASLRRTAKGRLESL